MTLRSGKALPILLGLLVVGLVVAGVMWIPKLQNQAKLDAFGDRITISTAIRSTIVSVEDKTRKWPKNLDEIKSEPKIAALGNLDGVKYDFVKVDENENGVYSFTMGEKTQQVTIQAKRNQAKAPMGAAPQ
ncbi:MAG TPA: hypothetical protein PKA27_08805 [Fimbriimonadaceae bacterium]|nr:hypothetical protein [Fimbriimonadaceae bacterium]